MYLPVSDRFEAMCFNKNSNEMFARMHFSVEEGKNEYIWEVPPPPETDESATQSDLPPARLDAEKASKYQK
jgi:hypothetical protein